jgi:hypothetical protein
MVQFAYVDYKGLGRPQSWASLPHATHPPESRQNRGLHKRYDHPVEQTLCRFSLIDGPLIFLLLPAAHRAVGGLLRAIACRQRRRTSPRKLLAAAMHLFQNTISRILKPYRCSASASPLLPRILSRRSNQQTPPYSCPNTTISPRYGSTFWAGMIFLKFCAR